ncbi:MAG: FHA domain-containing serine/threonine-protein kinase [Planctomycetaceae bacterium]
MQVPAVATDFLALIERSELLTADQVREVAARSGITTDMPPEQVARKLVHDRILTPFQAERLLEGRYRGFVIDGYRIREVLGVGGMGCVYIAEDRDGDRKVALKVMSSRHAIDPGMLARLKLEAIAGSEVKHPNVVQTFNVGDTGAVHYIVLEFMRGISLHELVALHGPVKWSMACDMFAQAAAGLQAAHEAGIIHRDIKPANLLIDKEGVTKVLDFGLAKIEGSAGDEFSLAMIFGHDCLGTPDYIAPEQADDSNSVQETADVYSLGCTMYVALTGRIPFPQKTNAAKIQAHKTTKAKSISEFRRDVPDEVVAIVEKMMEKNPADRYQSAAEVAAALRPWAKRRPVNFEFRQLVTLRAQQARDKEAANARAEQNRPRKKPLPMPPRSSITSNSWLQNSGHHLESGIDTFAADDTPAIRQPAPMKTPAESRASAPAVVHRPAPVARLNVPRGWYIQRLKSTQQIPLTRVKSRVGRSPECEIKMPASRIDARQCFIEFNGSEWHLRQESRSQPTFVNGKAETFARLRHGSRITFSDGTGFDVICEEDRNRTQKSRWTLILLLTLGVAAGIVAAVLLLNT